MQKSPQQLKCESGHYFGDWRPTPEKRRITKVSAYSPCKVGEIVTVKKWGTFGCWDEKNRWVDFWSSEGVIINDSWFARLVKKVWASIKWFLGINE